MAKIIKQRMTADIEGDFVVFLIGARFNKLWNLPKHFWFVKSMPGMLKELEKQPEMGLLGYRQHFGLRSVSILQYWRSYEHLEAYSRNRDAIHFPNWVRFNKTVGSNGDIGIWHETYKVAAGQYETVYNNMPAYGLGEASKLVPAAGYRTTARGRITGQESAPAVEVSGDVPQPADVV
jgi:Monooxygenase af470-like